MPCSARFGGYPLPNNTRVPDLELLHQHLVRQPDLEVAAARLGDEQNVGHIAVWSFEIDPQRPLGRCAGSG
jgi:hypothetical protein